MFWKPPLFTCFSIEFTANLRYTLINEHGLNKIFPPSPRTKLRSLTYEKYVKSAGLVTSNTVQGERGVNLNYIFLT